MSLFVTFEGVEGCGKTTQARRLADHLEGCGRRVLLTREPGGSAATEVLRTLLADRSAGLDGRAELLLFLADRAAHVATDIRPALARGDVVLCDRYSDSTLAYQGWGRGHDRDWVERLNAWASYGTEPDLTLWIDCDVTTGLGRARGPEAAGDRFEAEPLDFHERVREGFAALAARFPQRIVRIDGDRPLEEVTADVLATADARLAAAAAAR